ncbi:hypothetical protein [Pseudidiomarina salilacus]|uniref:hypothetical protein n=1 Tax=Pseudidiomarina salilacus TaxID=3384452 RepID=UPI00398546C0
MTGKQLGWGTFSVGFLLVGIPFWLEPYETVTVPNSFFGWGVLVVFLAAAFLRALAHFSFLHSWLIAGAIIPAVTMARTLVEVVIDPTSNNLWPLVLILAAGTGAIVAIAGAGIASLFVRRG